MKDHLTELVRRSGGPSGTQGLNVAREYLQARILACLQRHGLMVPLAFHGGTALRFLHNIPRYSEDLNFTLERTRESYDLDRLLGNVGAEFKAEGYEIEFKVSRKKSVHAAFVRFQGLPHELGLSPHRKQVLSVKIEVDTDPPGGAGLATTVVRRHVALQLQHHDRGSLLAGKLHALFQRPYTKGRDIHDLFWYLSDADWPEPNLTLLNNALARTGRTGKRLTASNWRAVTERKLGDVDFKKARNDVAPFLEPVADVELLTHGNLVRLVRKGTKKTRHDR